MSVIFCGGEAEDVTVTGAVGFGTTAGRYRNTHTRGYLSVPGSSTFATNYVRGGFAAASTVGVTARVHALTALTANTPFFWLATGGSARLRLKVNSAAPSTITLESYNGTTATSLQTSTATIVSDMLYRLDVSVSFGASGSVKVWVDSALVIDYSGNTAAGGGTTLDSVNLGPMAAGATTGWSEIIVTDGQDPRTLSLKTLIPDSVGAANAWVGAWSDVDDVTASDTDVMSSATANQVANLGLTGMPAGWSNLTVTAVKLVASAARGAAGPSKLALGVRTNSADSFPTATTLDTGFSAAVTTTYILNPVTGLAWTPAEIDALQLALRSEA